MTTRKKRLGRGLDALLSAEPDASQTGETTLRELPLDLIEPGRFQPRSAMDPEKLAELADSIRAQGVVQPIVVRPVGAGDYEIVAGERRWRAAQMAGLHDIPAVIRDVPDQVATAIAIIENVQREDLNPLEEARALNRLLSEFSLTHQEVADAVGRSRVAVTNILRLLELRADVKKLLDERRLEMGHARALLGLQGAAQSKAARDVARRGLSVRETEALIRRLQKADGAPPTAIRREDPDIRRLQDQLSEKLAARVRLQHQASGKGKLIIEYTSLDELEGILARIR
ncbi:MAG: ParB/RepB/Spo0J family partition protein [Gammaproteobacteria bacterium]|nr:MAG: ParB/RepB/Spo0J family partition protein [Gammaproteobacteria bacterium]